MEVAEDFTLALHSMPEGHTQTSIYYAIKCMIVNYLVNRLPDRPMSLSVLRLGMQLDARLREIKRYLDFGVDFKTHEAVGTGVITQLKSEMASLEIQAAHRIIERYATSFNIISPEFISLCKHRGNALLEAMIIVFRCWFQDPFDAGLNVICIKLLVSCFDIYNIGVYSSGQMYAVFRLLGFPYHLTSSAESFESRHSNDDVVQILLNAQYSSKEFITCIVNISSQRNIRSYRFRKDFIRGYMNATLCANVFYPPLSCFPSYSDKFMMQKRQLLAVAQECIFSHSTLGQ